TLTDVRMGREVGSLPEGFTAVVRFDRGLERYARSDDQGNVTVCRVSDAAELARLPGFGVGAFGLVFSPDGSHLLAWYNAPRPGQSGNCILWDWQRGARVLEPPFVGVAPAFSPDGTRFSLVRQSDGTLVLYDVGSRKEVRQIALGFSP